MRQIVIYSGRFQPFGKHHYQSYKHLCEKFGTNNVFIATTDNIDEQSPLTFEDKVKIFNKYNIDNVYKVKNTYKCFEITSFFDINNTSIIFAVGKKDQQRINTNKYFKPYTDNNDLEPLSKHGYIYVLPHVSIYYNNIELSGTNIRKLLSTANPTQFKDIMGWYDPNIDVMCKQSFNIVEHAIFNAVTSLDESVRITKTELLRIEQYIDKFFKQFNIDIDFQNLYQGTHFYQRLNDPRNSTPITGDDLRKIFKKVSIKHGLHLSKLNAGAEGVLTDMETDVNIPFIMKWDRDNQEIDLVPKTIMKKKDFKTSTPRLAVENTLKNYSKHIQHPYEDKTMTCDDMCRFVEDVLTAPEKVKCTIKLDGQNLQMTYKDGQFYAARNKSTIIKPMTLDELSNKFIHKPDIHYTFTEAFKSVQECLQQFSHDELNWIFQNGTGFLNFEIIHPRSKNLFDYGQQPIISLHSLIYYTDGNERFRNNDMLEVLPLNIYNNFKIQITPTHVIKPLNNNIVTYFKNKIKLNYNNPIELKKTFWKLGVTVIPNIDKNIMDINSIINEVKLKYKNSSEMTVIDDTLKNLYELQSFSDVNFTCEGLVIEWENKLFKLTGVFGCLIPLLVIYNKDKYAN